MNDFKNLLICFDQELDKVTISEDDRQFIVEGTIVGKFNVDGIKLKDELNKFPKRDSIFIYLSINESESITISTNNANVDDFVREVSGQLEGATEKPFTSIKIIIEKAKSNGCISIYSMENFANYLINQNLKGLLFVFNRLTTNDNYIVFECFEKFVAFQSHRYIFKHFNHALEITDITSTSERSSILSIRNSLCHFSNSSQYYFLPEDFILEQTESVNKKILSVFNRLAIIFSIINIFDYTIIDKKKLIAKLNGYKTHSFSISFNTIDLEILSTYFSLYKWVYSGGNYSDKIGLARNVLSLHFTENSVNKIKGDVNTSVISSYEIYLKKNVEHYIAVKNKVSEFLNNLNERATSIIDNFSSSFRNSFFAFLSFFTSVFILRYLSKGDINEIVSPDLFWLTQGFLFVSLIYLIISTWEINKNKKRFERNYKNNKTRYCDILDENDIDKIFNHDEDFRYDISFIKKRIYSYFSMWLVSIILFSGLITYLTFYMDSKPSIGGQIIISDSTNVKQEVDSNKVIIPDIGNQ